MKVYFQVLAHECLVLGTLVCHIRAGFLSRILWCSQSNDIDLKNNLAKFGYILIRKKKKKKIFLYSWLPTGTYHKILAVWNLFLKKSGECGSFFPWKILCVGRNHIFLGWNLAKICQWKKHYMRLLICTCNGNPLPGGIPHKGSRRTRQCRVKPQSGVIPRTRGPGGWGNVG